MPGGLNRVPCRIPGGGGSLGRASIGALQHEGAQMGGFGRLSRFEAPSRPRIHVDFADQLAVSRMVEGMETETRWTEAIFRAVAWMEKEPMVRVLLKRGQNARA